MSKERELLKKWLIDFGVVHPSVKLMRETQELLAQPEQKLEPSKLAFIIANEIADNFTVGFCDYRMVEQFAETIEKHLPKPEKSEKSEADKLKDAIELQVTVALSESISRLTTSITARGR